MLQPNGTILGYMVASEAGAIRPNNQLDREIIDGLLNEIMSDHSLEPDEVSLLLSFLIPETDEHNVTEIIDELTMNYKFSEEWQARNEESRTRLGPYLRLLMMMSEPLWHNCIIWLGDDLPMSEKVGIYLDHCIKKQEWPRNELEDRLLSFCHKNHLLIYPEVKALLKIFFKYNLSPEPMAMPRTHGGLFFMHAMVQLTTDLETNAFNVALGKLDLLLGAANAWLAHNEEAFHTQYNMIQSLNHTDLKLILDSVRNADLSDARSVESAAIPTVLPLRTLLATYPEENSNEHSKGCASN